MLFILISIEYIIAFLLLFALLMAIFSHIKFVIIRTWKTFGLIIGAVVFNAILPAVFLNSYDFNQLYKFCFYISLFLWVLITVGCIFLLCRGIFTRDSHNQPLATHWSIKKLALFTLAAIALNAATIFISTKAIQYITMRSVCSAQIHAKSFFPEDIPDSENAAIIYEMILNQLPDSSDNPQTYYKYYEILHDCAKLDKFPSSHELNEFFDSNNHILALAHRASKMPYANFNIDHDSFDLFRGARNENGEMEIYDSYNKPPPCHYTIGVFLTVSALRHIVDNNLSCAIEDINSKLNLSKHLLNEPTQSFIGQSRSNFENTKLVIEILLASPDLTEQHLNAIIPLDDICFQQSLLRPLIIDHASSLTMMHQISNGKMTFIANLDGKGTTPLYITIPYTIIFLHNDINASDYHYTQFENLVSTPYHSIHEALQHLDDKCKIANQENTFLLKLLSEPYARRFLLTAESDAHLRLTRLAIAMELHRLKVGSYPNQLTSLVPHYIDAIPTDPFDGKPLNKTTIDGKVSLYSVYKDFDDDNASPWNYDSDSGDLIFTLQH